MSHLLKIKELTEQLDGDPTRERFELGPWDNNKNTLFGTIGGSRISFTPEPPDKDHKDARE